MGVTSVRTSAIATFMAGVGILLPASLGLLISGTPKKLCPLPLLTVIPELVLSTPYVAILVPVLFFFVWHRGLFHGETRIPRRSYALLGIVTVLNTIYLITGWKWGVEYEGAEYARTVCIVSAAWNSVLVFAFGHTWKNGSSFKTNLFVHWMLFAWLAWYAFPYLGELP